MDEPRYDVEFLFCVVLFLMCTNRFIAMLE